MLVLPSVGSEVVRIVLNESATKAKLFFNDGSTAIIATKNTPTTTSVKKFVTTPSKTSVSKVVRTSNGVVKQKKVVKSVSEGIGFRVVKTPNGMINVPIPTKTETPTVDTQKIIERAKARAAMLEEQTMDAGARAAANMTEGAEISLT